MKAHQISDPMYIAAIAPRLVGFHPPKKWPTNLVSNVTPPKINMEHNNGGLEDDFPFQIGDF